MTVLAIDAGNTRIKWGFHNGHGWAATGAVGRETTYVTYGQARMPRGPRLTFSRFSSVLRLPNVSWIVGWRERSSDPAVPPSSQRSNQ